VGVNHDYSVQFGPDINYRASSRAEFHLFYTFLREYRAMRALNAATNTAGKISVLNDFEYSENTTYDIHTVGLGGTFHCTDDIKLVADYIFTHGNLAFAQAGSWTLGQGSDLVGGDPNMNDHSTDHQVKLHTVYDYSPSTQVFVGYQFDSVAMEDWALVGKSIGQVLTGNISPKYNVSTITAGLTLKI
jgi:predicted porin